MMKSKYVHICIHIWIEIEIWFPIIAKRNQTHSHSATQPTELLTWGVSEIRIVVDTIDKTGLKLVEKYIIQWGDKILSTCYHSHIQTKYDEIKITYSNENAIVMLTLR